MNLVIDIGNTRTKFSVFNKGEVLITVPVDEFLPSHIEVLQYDHPQLKKVILSSVRDYSPELKKTLQEKFEYFIELDENTLLPIENCYNTPETLGKDRIAAAVGGFDLYPDTNLLIIDAGTAITYDILNSKHQFLGGNISPELKCGLKHFISLPGNYP